MTDEDRNNQSTYDGCDVQHTAGDACQSACEHSHRTMCTPWCKCLQLMTTQFQPGEVDTDDAGVPAAPTIQHVLIIYKWYSKMTKS